MTLINFDSVKQKTIKTKKHDVPEWDGYLFVRKLSAVQRDDVAAFHKKAEENESWLDSMVNTIIIGAVDEAVEPIFKEEHAEELKEMDGDAITGIYQAILKFNGIDKSSEENSSEAVKP